MTTTGQQKNPVELLEKQVRLLEQILQEQHTQSSHQPTVQKREFSLSKHAGSGAIFAALIASLWVVHYLLSAGNFLPYWQWVTEIRNTEGLGLTEALFIIVARFLVAFGLTWPPITVIIAIIRRFI